MNELSSYQSSYKDYKEEKDADGMANCIIQMSQLIRMTQNDEKTKKEASTKCQTIAEEAVKVIAELPIPTEDKVHSQTRCLCEIALLYETLGENEAAIHTYDHGITMMKSKLKNPGKYQVYGTMLNNKGLLLERRALYHDALNCYVAAMNAHKKAVDFSCRAVREKSVKRNRANIRDVNRKLKLLSHSFKDYRKFVTATPDYRRFITSTMYAACKISAVGGQQREKQMEPV